jgi:hypothetical protein
MELKEIKSKSGNVAKAGRDEKTGLVTIHFRGRKANDPVVPYQSQKPFSKEEWDAFESTFSNEGNSTGSYFHSHFRATKDFKKI